MDTARSSPSVSVEDLDQWYAMVAAIPCFRGQPDIVLTPAAVSAADSSRGGDAIRLAYQRAERANRVMLRDVQLVSSAWDWLDPCLAAAIEGLSFDVTRLDRGAPGVSRAELVIPAGHLGVLVRELDASEPVR